MLSLEFLRITLEDVPLRLQTSVAARGNIISVYMHAHTNTHVHMDYVQVCIWILYMCSRAEQGKHCLPDVLDVKIAEILTSRNNGKGL